MYKTINIPIAQFKQEPNKCHSAVTYVDSLLLTWPQTTGWNDPCELLRINRGGYRENKKLQIPSIGC